MGKKEKIITQGDGKKLKNKTKKMADTKMTKSHVELEEESADHTDASASSSSIEPCTPPVKQQSTSKKSKAVEIETDGKQKKKVKKEKNKRSKPENSDNADDETDGTVKKKAKKAKTGDEKEKSTSSSSVDSSTTNNLDSFGISASTCQRLQDRGITSLFPIQALTFQKIMNGCDLIGRARTGCGKTLAFVLPVVELLQNEREERGCPPKVLVMAPTRELAKQVAEEFEATSPANLKSVCIYGGAPYRPQEEALRRGVQVVVGTPGRILDHIERGTLRLSAIKFLILDEADSMLDMGFKEDIQKVCEAMGGEGAGGGKRQVLLFSATLPPWVQKVAKQYMRQDKLEQVDLVQGENAKASTDVRHIAIPCHWSSMASTISDCLAVYGGAKARTIVFCETKKECNELVVNPTIKAESQALHGDIPQAQRETTLNAFREGRIRVLIATDVAARGLDMTVDLVIQSKPPVTASGRTDVETYVHRSGRTGRAGRKGICITLFSPKYRFAVKEIEAAVGNQFEWAGAPQPKDIVSASALAVMENVADVDDKVFPLFEAAAKKLMEEMGALEAISAALACLTGHTKELRPRSLLSNSDGFVTFGLKADQTMHSSGYVWSALRRILPVNVTEEIRGMQLTADSIGAVFDVPSQYMKTHMKQALEENDWLYQVQELPTLKQQLSSLNSRFNNNAGGGFRGGGRGRGFGGGGRGRFGNGNNGFGRARGGGGFRSRGGAGAGFRGGRR